MSPLDHMDNTLHFIPHDPYYRHGRSSSHPSHITCHVCSLPTKPIHLGRLRMERINLSSLHSLRTKNTARCLMQPKHIIQPMLMSPQDHVDITLHYGSYHHATGYNPSLHPRPQTTKVSPQNQWSPHPYNGLPEHGNDKYRLRYNFSLKEQPMIWLYLSSSLHLNIMLDATTIALPQPSNPPILMGPLLH